MEQEQGLGKREDRGVDAVEAASQVCLAEEGLGRELPDGPRRFEGVLFRFFVDRKIKTRDERGRVV